MNYMTEIKLFYDWLDTHDLSSMGISLWHALMQIASRSGWQPELRVSLSTLAGRSSLSRTTIYKEREILRQYGLINFRSSGGRGTGIYCIRSLESRFVSGSRTQAGTQPSPDVGFASPDASVPRTQCRTQFKPDAKNASLDASAARTQVGTQVGTHTSLSRLNYTNPSEEIKEVAGKPATEPIITPPKKEKSCGKKERSVAPLFDVESIVGTIEEPWQELMIVWLDYRRCRRERYKSDLSVKKCLMQLKRLANDDPHVAWQIIDQSIANNWAGLFPLRSGQHPGQVLCPVGEKRIQSLMEKFGRK